MDRVRRALKQWSSFRLPPDAKERVMKDTGWADGLRGIAAVFVVSSHVVICYARILIPPCCAPSSTKPYLFQLPIFRLVASGHSWVAIFFILMGFVNALKPLQLARSNQIDKALQKLASSSFSRIFRLVLPATAATIISWLICNLGLYATSAQSDAYWLHENTPLPSKSGYEAVVDLFYGLRATWVYGEQNPYDQTSMGSCISAPGQYHDHQRLVSGGDNDFKVADTWTGLCCFLGIILSEFSLSNIPGLIAPYSPFLSPPAIFLSLFLMSYPSSYAEAASWSTWLRDIAVGYFPTATLGAVERLYGSIGGVLLIGATIISPHARWALSRRPLLWLGKASFAIYLLHGMFLRTIFAWVLHLGQSKVITTAQGEGGHAVLVERYPLPGYFQRLVATVIMGVCVAVASHFWNSKLEPVFAKITSKLEGVVSGKAQLIEPQSSGGTLLPLRKD